MPDVTDDHTKKRRRRHNQTRCLHDDLTKGKMDSEFNMNPRLREAFREFFDMPKILAPLTKFLLEPEKVHRRPYDGLNCPHEWPDVFTIRAEHTGEYSYRELYLYLSIFFVYG